MPRKKLLLQTNAPYLKTGLGENAQCLMRHFARSDRYELVLYCSQVMANDPNLARLPVKAYGCIPADQGILQQLNQDPGRARDVAYGSFFIDEIVQKEKVDIYLGSDDVWGFSGITGKPWWSKINSVLHITIDSLPILEHAYEQARTTPHYVTWAKFAAKEMKKRGSEYGHVQTIYGAFDTSHFAPISREEKLQVRRQMGIDPNATVFFYLSRNQLRKQFPTILEAFAEFKKRHPKANAKLYFHTSVSEKSAGWDLPRLIQYRGIKNEDVLFTHVCRSCGKWHVKPYSGEDLDCPHCGAQKSVITTNIQHGVPEEEMKYVHGIADCSINAFSSGGLERGIVSSLLCGLPTAVTNYSSGEDFCQEPFVQSLDWQPYYEAGTSFIKAATSVSSIVAFMEKVHDASDKTKQEIGEQSRDWAERTFSTRAIGAQWESLFDSMPAKDWSTITLTPAPKNPNYPMPQMPNPEQWVRALYNNILMVEPDPDGLKHWLAQLQAGIPREAIYRFFIGRAHEDNAKSAPPQDFGTLFDQTGRKKVLFVMKESGGDVFISTALFPGLKRLYPDSDLYVACEPKFADILAGNEHVHKVLPYHPAMESELHMMNYVDHYIFPAVQTQRQLGYLSRKCGLDLKPHRYDSSQKAVDAFTNDPR